MKFIELPCTEDSFQLKTAILQQHEVRMSLNNTVLQHSQVNTPQHTTVLKLPEANKTLTLTEIECRDIVISHAPNQYCTRKRKKTNTGTARHCTLCENDPEPAGAICCCVSIKRGEGNKAANLAGYSTARTLSLIPVCSDHHYVTGHVL